MLQASSEAAEANDMEGDTMAGRISTFLKGEAAHTACGKAKAKAKAQAKKDDPNAMIPNKHFALCLDNALRQGTRHGLQKYFLVVALKM